MIRLTLVASLLLIGTGCFQSHGRLTLTATGQGHWEQRADVEPTASKMLAMHAKEDPEFKHAFAADRIDRERLAAEGLTGVIATLDEGKRWKLHLATDFTRPEALSQLLDRHGHGKDPIDLREVGDREYVLTLAVDSDDDKDKEAPEKPEDEMPEKKKQKLLGKLFVEMTKLEMVQQIDVPGEILEAKPAGAVISGGSATWTQGPKEVLGDLGAALSDTPPAEPPPPRNTFIVRFRTEAPLPPEALSPPG